MSHHRPGRSRLCAMSVALLLGGAVLPRLAGAQDRVALHGAIRDTAGAPVAGADVFIVAIHRLARTDDSGVFVLRDVPLGRHDLGVRRLGFDPRTLGIEVAAAQIEPLIVVLRMQAVMLPGLTVSEREMRRRISIEDFYRRRARGPGTFVTRDDIEARHAGRVSDALRGVPGLQFVRVRGVTGVRFVSSAIQRRDCVPQVWLDGTRVDNVEVDELPVGDVEGIELYQGPSTTPMQFSQGAISSCGTIVIWSRVPGT